MAMEVQQVWMNSLRNAQSVLERFVAEEQNLKNCQQFSNILIEAYTRGSTVFSCGNGGSHCDAMHFAEEMTGRYRKDRRPLGALALGDPSHVTCVSNDYGFNFIFSRQLEALARQGDVLLVLSTSGHSENVIRAVQSAKSQGLKTIALLGKGGGKLKDLVDLPLLVPGETSDRIQEIHIKLIHIVIETVERKLFPGHYA
jgi:D-sedoheptulose 7-phosphate isomerase